MVSCGKFKQEVFAALLGTVISLGLLCASVLSEFWVEGTAGYREIYQPDWTTTVHFGLFRGQKVRERQNSCTREISIKCLESVCMFSCGSGDNATQDITDILGENLEDTISGDYRFCGNCGSTEERTISNLQQKPSLAQDDTTDRSQMMMSMGIYSSCLAFLLLGLLFTLVNIILSIVNLSSNPAGPVLGVDGLVVWNFGSFFSYLLVLILWGSLFIKTLSENLCISETLRRSHTAEESDWSSVGEAKLGYGYWLIFPAVILHLVNTWYLGYSQYKRYYAPKPRNAKNLETRIQENTAGGNDMLF